MLHNVVNDLFLMPQVMRQLAVVQFLSWFALFAMWIYTTAAVTAHHYGTTDPASAAYNEGANWVGVLFAAYNGFAALAALFIPTLAARLGRRRAHLVGLWCGALGLVSIRFIDDPQWLLRVDDRRRHRLGVDPVTAVRDAVAGRAGAEDGHLHGHLQFLHRDPADPRGERARHPACACCSTATSIDALALGGALHVPRGARDAARRRSRRGLRLASAERIAAPQDARTISFGWISTDSTASPATRCIRLSTSISAARWVSCCTVVSGGLKCAAEAMSSKPTTATSPGTEMPRVAQCADHADRNRVARGEDRIECGAAGEQLPAALVARVFARLRFDEQARVGFDAGFALRRFAAAITQPGIPANGRRRCRRYAMRLRPRSQQVACRLPCAGGVVRAHVATGHAVRRSAPR